MVKNRQSSWAAIDHREFRTWGAKENEAEALPDNQKAKRRKGRREKLNC